MTVRNILAKLLIFIPLLLIACGGSGETDIPGIDEIHASEGVPVLVRELEPEPFAVTLAYTSTLSGAIESTASAMLTDEVEQVHAKVGDYVEKDQTIISFPADNPSLNYEQARLNFESARTSFERIRTLYAEEGVSRQSYDNARTQYEIARANWDTVRAMKDVKAPVGGFLTRLNVLESDNVSPGDALFTVSDASRLKTTVWITDREISRIRVGQPARAEWRGNVVAGRVIQADMAMDQTRKAFAVKLEFNNADGAVPSGVTAKVEIEIYRNDAALVADMAEIAAAGSESYVYLAVEGESRRVTVETGRQQGLDVELVSGVEPGDALITTNPALLSDGGTIRVLDGDGTER